MPEPITWDPLAKSIDDNTTIDEEIDAILLAHNLDPSAHSQSSEAIFAHKNAPVLDHVDGSIYNAHIQTANRTYDAIVDAAGNADFDDIQDAIDFVATLGGGTIFVRSGSYDVHLGLTIYSHIKITGEDNSATILHGVGDDLWLLIQGVEGTPIVDVLLQNLCFTNLYVDDPYVLMGYCEDITIDRCRFTFPDDPGYFPNWCIGTSGPMTRIHITNNIFDNIVGAIACPVSSAVWVENNYFVDYLAPCIDTYNCVDLLILNNYFDHEKAGHTIDAIIYAEDNAGNLRILGNIFNDIGNGAMGLINMRGAVICNNQILSTNTSWHAIQIDSADYSIISNNYIYNAKLDGINIIDDSNRNTIVGNVCYGNHRYGIRIDGADCDKNIVANNVCYNNTSGNISDAGTGTVNANNVTT